MSKSEAKERSVFSKICSILIDIFIVPVIVIAFVCAILMSSAKANNKVPSVLGNSIVEVLTPSMAVEGGFYPGDVLIIDQTVNKDNLQVGDCIAFYAPEESGWVTDNGDSLIIFHRIVRIIYTDETINGEPTGKKNVKHFVCRGDAVGKLSASDGTLIPTQAKKDGLPQDQWGGDYDENGNLYDEKGNRIVNGGYVVKLLDESASKDKADLQYVTAEYVVGKFKARAGGFISALVKFCCSEIGIILLVIIPSGIMIAIVATSIVQESRLAKAERETDQLTMAKNISIMNDTPEDEAKKNDAKQEEKPEDTPKIEELNTDKKQEDKKVENVAQQDAQNTKSAPKVPEVKEEPKEKAVPKAPNKKEPKVAPTKVETPKEAPAKPATKPTIPKTEPKPVAPKPESAKPVTPKTPTAPKSAPSKSVEPKAPVAPKKAPLAPKPTPTKPEVPKAPSKVPPKKG
ncbi:MAG: hypothetical protein SOV27_04760 [Eubacteriales bacterium]|nr:hypothetical protein [Eubacteriales bacterium]